MGIDKETKLKYINIVFDDNARYLAALRAQAQEDDQNDDSRKKLSITDDKAIFETEEYYYDEQDNAIHISGVLKSQDGEAGIYFTLPLSDIVLMDILHGAIKKFNKLKTTLEALK